MKRFLTGLLAIALLTSLLFTSASAASRQKSGNFSYEIKGNGTAKIVGYNGSDEEDIYIPRMLDGYTVTEIGKEGLSKIGKHSYGNEGIAIIIPDTVTTIGEKAFADSTAVKLINIPSSVTEIGSGAFVGLKSNVAVDSNSSTFATIDGNLYMLKSLLLIW